MSSRDYRDILAGGLLMALGLFAALYAWVHYNLGTITHMGPGMFPAALGFLLAGIGLLIFVPALFRTGTMPKLELRPLASVLVGVLAFALTVNWIGMVPAIFLLTGASVLADNKLGVLGTLVLATALSTMAVLIFRIGLGIPLYPFIWPF